MAGDMAACVSGGWKKDTWTNPGFDETENPGMPIRQAGVGGLPVELRNAAAPGQRRAG